MVEKIFQPIDNYIFLYHINKYIVLPCYPESITDSTPISFSSSTPLGRSAPIYSFQGAGPRSFSVSMTLHRDMMTQINYGVSNVFPDVGDDYVDTLVKLLQAGAVPRYSSSAQEIEPPMIAIRFGNEIYLKGVMTGVSVSYGLPILENDKYAQVTISFSVEEIDPYDADVVQLIGSFRCRDDNTLTRGAWGKCIGDFSSFASQETEIQEIKNTKGTSKRMRRTIGDETYSTKTTTVKTIVENITDIIKDCQDFLEETDQTGLGKIWNLGKIVKDAIGDDVREARKTRQANRDYRQYAYENNTSSADQII